MKFAVVVFPGSNCDVDCHRAAHDVMGQPTRYVRHDEVQLDGYDCVLLPGGFSYGDYLRAGAIARFAPIMAAVQRFAERGGLVLGICNGFQILCEAGLLPGALRRNKGLHFRCETVHVRIDNAETAFTARCRLGQVLALPIAHGEGNYFCDEPTLATLQANNRVVLRYCDADGRATEAANPNGSLNNIAGIVSEAGNVLGMMPHPERNAEHLLGNADGRLIFDSLVDAGLRGVQSASAGVRG